MSKADVIEVEGTVVENYQRKTSHELYSYFTG